MKKNPLSRIIKLLIILIILFVLYKTINNSFIKNELKQNYSLNDSISDNEEFDFSKEEIITNNKTDVDHKVSLVAIGDIMCHNTQFKDAYKNGSYDFSYVFENIKPNIENADIAIGNLETTFAGSKRGYSGYPQFNTPEILATNLKELGIDVLTTPNNHCLDTGYSGLESTIDFLDEAGISHTGTFKTPEEQNNILFKEINGIKFAFLAFTYGTNGIPIPKGKEYCVNLIDKDLILSQIKLAKEGNPDVICTSMHWGIEYQRQPNNEQKELADFLFSNGVDIILGSHPHVLEPFEKREVTLEDGTVKDGFVIYSLGNFMSGQNQTHTKNSIILNINITKHSGNGKITIDDISYIPIYTYSASFKNYKILNINKTLEQYSNGESPLPANISSTLKGELKSITDLLDN